MIRVWICLFGATLAFLAWNVGDRNAVAQPPANADRTISTSVSECKVCHSGPTSGLRDYIDKCKSLDFIKLTESLTWEGSDPHSIPFTQLMDGESGRKMKSKYPEATTNPACLACHAVDTGRKENRFAGVESNGIGCTARHGLEKEWQSKHYESPTGAVVPWREWSPKAKTEAGMKNLRDPIVKANLCASCHVGNPSESKVITHEMYAAGHPPLPPFELLSFMESEPKHWGTPFEMPYLKGLTEAKANELFGFSPGEGNGGLAARHLIAGALAALKAEVALQKAESKSLPPSAGFGYARFDCYACHHDLKLPSERQKRGYDGPPGRPPMKAWIGALALVAANHIGRGNEFTRQWSELKREMYDKPYGNPLTVGPLAERLEEWCRRCETDATQWNVANIEPLRDALLAEAGKHAADPEAALTLLWAYRGLSKAAGKPFADNEWNRILPIVVRSGPHSNGGKPVPLTTSRTQRMTAFNAFSPEEFRKWMGK